MITTKAKAGIFPLLSAPEIPAAAMPTRLTFLYRKNKTYKYCTWMGKTRMKQLGNAAHLTYVLTSESQNY